MHHLYLHIPFCARRCSYCDFSIAVRKQVPAEEYVRCIAAELELVLSRSGTAQGMGGGLYSLYLGGGTPSLLPPEAIAELIRMARERLGFTVDVEITLEANPDDVTTATAAEWRRAGVNRVSLGAQSFDDRALRWMHRVHEAGQTGEAVRLLRAAGITNLSLDLIFALPAELERDWEQDLESALALQPSHLSLYGLTVEARTPLARWIDRGRSSAPDDESYEAEYLEAHQRLAARGYRFYEVSNAAALPEYRSRHNTAYWSGRPYLGLGPAAHSFDGRARRWNLSAWEAYRRAVLAGASPVQSEETLTSDQRELEHIYLALRTRAGVPTAVLARPLPPITTRWVREGWVEVNDRSLSCTPAGWLRLDELVSTLTGVPVAT